MSDEKIVTEEAEALVASEQTEAPAADGGKKQKKPPLSKEEKKILWQARWSRWKAWVYLLPAIVILGIFTVWPIINTVRISFMGQWTTEGGSTWWEGYSYSAALNPNTHYVFGFNNFSSVVSDIDFVTCLTNTLLLTVITVPISTMLALLIAVALNSIKPLRKVFQTIFFLPYVTNSIAIGMVFAAMFQMVWPNPTGEPMSVGIINTIIEAFGGTRINWMNQGSSHFANMVVLVIYIVWNALPFKILVLLGGLQSVNKQYYDAAKVDGTSRFRTFWRITVPLLSPMIAYVVITGFIGGFKEYTSIVGIFGEKMGPVGNDWSLDTMVGYIYKSMGVSEGKAGAAALILFVIIFAVTMVNLYVSKKKVHY